MMLSAVFRGVLLLAVPVGFLIGMLVAVQSKDDIKPAAAGGERDIVITGSVTQ